MTIRQNLINRILACDLMDRNDQESNFNQYQSEYDEVKLPDHLHIFFSYYSYEDYSGYGFVYGYDESTDTFFYNSGSHCSCYGLEGQWDIEEYTFEQMVACIEREIQAYSKEDHYYESDRSLNETKVELLKLVLGDV
jgi:hypothetical protein